MACKVDIRFCPSCYINAQQCLAEGNIFKLFNKKQSIASTIFGIYCSHPSLYGFRYRSIDTIRLDHGTCDDDFLTIKITNDCRKKFITDKLELPLSTLNGL
jgi:hypothetical protein